MQSSEAWVLCGYELGRRPEGPIVLAVFTEESQAKMHLDWQLRDGVGDMELELQPTRLVPPGADKALVADYIAGGDAVENERVGRLRGRMDEYLSS